MDTTRSWWDRSRTGAPQLVSVWLRVTGERRVSTGSGKIDARVFTEDFRDGAAGGYALRDLRLKGCIRADTRLVCRRTKTLFERLRYAASLDTIRDHPHPSRNTVPHTAQTGKPSKPAGTCPRTPDDSISVASNKAGSENIMVTQQPAGRTVRLYFESCQK